MNQLWLHLENKGCGIRNFFTENRLKRVAIFGMGDHGEFVANAALSAGVEIVCCLDPTRSAWEGGRIFPLAAYDRLAGADAVIVCRGMASRMGPQEFDVEMRELYRNVDVPLYSIATVLEWCLFKYCLIPYLKHTGAKNNLVVYVPNALDLHDEGHYDHEEWLFRKAKERFFNDLRWRRVAYEGEPAEDLTEYYTDVTYLPSVVRRDGRYCILDHASRFLNVIGGMRLVRGNPEEPDRRVRVFGNSVAFGNFVDDGRTAASFLQKACRRNDKYKSTSVVDQSVGGVSMSMMNLEYYRIVEGSGMQPGDSGCFIIGGTHATPEPLRFWRAELMRSSFNEMGLRVFDALDQFKKILNGGDLFFDVCHFTVPGLKLLGKIIFDLFENPQDVPDVSKPDRGGAGSGPAGNPAPDAAAGELEDFLAAAAAANAHGTASTVGAVIINGNPFTRGHRHLIERALADCDFLYCFVVEEDRSEFSFADRLELVKKGTADLANCVVLPSGKFIISTVTFPGYFHKDTVNPAAVDCFRDVYTFAKHIAPALRISKRFVGKEPFCQVTRAYNDAMRGIFPNHGIGFVEIERVGDGRGVAISASQVRKLAAEKRWGELEDLLPRSTLEYLKNRAEPV